MPARDRTRPDRPDAVLETIADMRRRGLTEREVCGALRISRATFYRRLAAIRRFAESPAAREFAAR